MRTTLTTSIGRSGGATVCQSIRSVANCCRTPYKLSWGRLDGRHDDVVASAQRPPPFLAFDASQRREPTGLTAGPLPAQFRWDGSGHALAGSSRGFRRCHRDYCAKPFLFHRHGQSTGFGRFGFDDHDVPFVGGNPMRVGLHSERIRNRRRPPQVKVIPNSFSDLKKRSYDGLGTRGPPLSEIVQPPRHLMRNGRTSRRFYLVELFCCVGRSARLAPTRWDVPTAAAHCHRRRTTRPPIACDPIGHEHCRHLCVPLPSVALPALGTLRTVPRQTSEYAVQRRHIHTIAKHLATRCVRPETRKKKSTRRSPIRSSLHAGLETYKFVCKPTANSPRS